jgi:hypothetical protein
MISARDELLHLADCLSDQEAERVLELLETHCPELLGRLPDGDAEAAVPVTVPHAPNAS